MRNKHFSFLPLLLAAVSLLPACDGDGLDDVEADRSAPFVADDYAPQPLALAAGPIVPGGLGDTGELWGPCDLTDVAEPGWWGCNGDAQGNGAACLRPVSDDALSICVPQTADPFVGADCENVIEPAFGLGVRLKGSAYCVPDCLSDADCGAGRACSPASGYCAWVGPRRGR